MPQIIAGIFVGGRSKRMQGVPKGLLQPPGTTQNIVEGLVERLMAAGSSQVVLVGNGDAYSAYSWAVIGDSPRGQGPMAGLLGLAERAVQDSYEFVIAVACDMPFVDEGLLRRLCNEQLHADALVPRRQQWEPLCARYRAVAIAPRLERLLAAGQLRMMDLLSDLGSDCVELRIEPAQATALDDWDCAGDLPNGVRMGGRPFTPGRQ